MNAIAWQAIGTPGQRGHRPGSGGMRRAPGTHFGDGVTRTAAGAASAAPCRREDFAALVQVLETEGHFTPAPPDPPWADPRPDLAADTCTCAAAQRRCKCHARWLTLLELAYRRDGADPQGVFGALVGIRCCGAAIASSGGAKPAWRLLRGEMNAAAWQAVRAQWLTPALALARSAGASVPHLKALRELLGTPVAAQTEGAHTV